MVYVEHGSAHGGAEEFARRAAPPAPPARSSPTCRWTRPRRCGRPSPARAWRWCRCWRRPPRPSAARRSAPWPRGFVYVVSTVGTTGEREELPPGLAELVAATKADAEAPVAVGFGIGTPEQAAQVGEIADGVIIGSRLVRAAGEAGSPAGRRGRGRRIPARDARRPRRVSSAPMGMVVTLFLALAARCSPTRRSGRRRRRADLLHDPARRRSDLAQTAEARVGRR